MTKAREAIARFHADDVGEPVEDWFDVADDTITALREAGLRIVPEEPTEAMMRAGQKAWLTDPLRKSSTLYRAMISAYEDGK